MGHHNPVSGVVPDHRVHPLEGLEILVVDMIIVVTENPKISQVP